MKHDDNAVAFKYLARLLDQILNEQGKLNGDYTRAFGHDPKVGDPVLVKKECAAKIEDGFAKSGELVSGYKLIQAKSFVPGFVQFHIEKGRS